MRRHVLPLLFCLACVTAAVGAPKTLDMWVVDTESGKALLIVSPAGRSMLVDTGFPGKNMKVVASARVTLKMARMGLETRLT
jgi:hypothetical protein